MLVLTRKVGESIMIGDNIRVTIAEIVGNKARIGVQAPRDVTVDRQEIHERRNDPTLWQERPQRNGAKGEGVHAR